MDDNDKIIDNETNNSLLNGERQLTEVNGKTVAHQNFSNEFDNGQRSNQYTAIFKHCKDVHNGRKFEYHYHLPTTSDSIKIDKINNSIFVKCKEKLRNRYITNFAYMRSFFWDGKRNDLPIKDHFVELMVEKSSLFGKKEEEKINLEEIFSKEVVGHQTILFSGGSGYGKTTLCKKIAYDWATGGTSSTYLEHFDLVVVILLWELGEKSLYDLLLYNAFQNAEEVKSKIEKENLNILVMLDGFDEISNKNSVLKFIREESFDISLRMTILVTSRPEATEDIREDTMSRFSVEGFSEQQQQKYIQLMFKDHEDKGKELYEILKVKEYFSDIRKCPLILHMICCSYLNDGQCLKEGITDMYIRMVSLLIKRYRSKNNLNYNFKEGKYFYGEDLLIRLGKSKDIIFKDLKKLFPIEEEYNFIVGLGILELHSFSATDEDCHYHYVHFSFYEFIEGLTAYFYGPSLFSFLFKNASLFMIGLSGEEPFPEKVQNSFKMRYTHLMPLSYYNPKFMLQAYREIKIKTNWELLCSFSRLIFSYSDLDDVKILLPLYNFTRVYFIFPECKSTYTIFRDNLIDFYKNYNIFDNLVIFLFADIHNTDSIMPNLSSIDKKKLYANVSDHREVISCIIDFFNQIGPIKYKIYFSGFAYFANIFFCKNIECSKEIFKNQIEELNADENEEFVALQIDNEFGCKFNYVIAAEQYEILRDRIKIFPLSEREA